MDRPYRYRCSVDCLSVCWTQRRLTKLLKRLGFPLGVLLKMGPRNHVLRWGSDSIPTAGTLLKDILGYVQTCRQYGRTQYTQSYSLGGSSDAASRCHCCSNLLLLLLHYRTSEACDPSICPSVSQQSVVHSYDCDTTVMQLRDNLVTTVHSNVL